MAKQTITNTEAGPRGFYNGADLVMLEPGETFEGDLSDEDVKSAKDIGYFAFGAAAAKAAADPLDHDGDGRKGGAKKAD